MKTFLAIAYSIVVMTLTDTDLSAQTLSLEDMIKNVRPLKGFKPIQTFVEKKGFEFDTTLVPNKVSKIYSFLSRQEFGVVGLDEDTVKMNNAVFIRIDEDVRLSKLTMMTGVKRTYEEFVVEMVKNKFKPKEHQDKNKPMSYKSELFSNIEITLAIVEAVKDEKRYARYQIVVNY